MSKKETQKPVMLSLAQIAQQSAKVVKRTVGKVVKWDVDGEEFEGVVDVLVSGSMPWSEASKMHRAMEDFKQSGKSAETYLVVNLVTFEGGESLTYEQADAIPASLFGALLVAIREANPKLFQAAEKAQQEGNP